MTNICPRGRLERLRRVGRRRRLRLRLRLRRLPTARPRSGGGTMRGRGSDEGATTTISASSTRGMSRIYNGGGHRSDRRVVVAAKDDDAGDRTGRVVAIAIAVAASVIPRGRHTQARSQPVGRRISC